MVSDVGALVLMSCQCLNIRPGVGGGMFTRGPSRSRSRDNSAPAPINSGVGSQQRSLHWALSPANRGQGLSTQRLSTPSWPPIDLRETANMSSVDKYVIQFCSKNKTNLLRLYGSWMFKRIWTSNVYWGYFKYEEWQLWDISIHCNVFILPLLLQFNFNNPSTNIQEQHHIKWD